MGVYFEYFLLDVFSLLTILLTSSYVYFTSCYTYWKRRNVPFIQPKFPYGNCESLDSEGVHFNGHTARYYGLIKEKGWKFGGVYLLNRPVLVLRDPELIKDVLAKDFDSFPRRTVYYNEKNDPISAHLFAIGGAEWRTLRAKLTPAFSSGKMKGMFPTVVQLTDHLVQALMEAERNRVDINVVDYSLNYTADVISSVAFGLDLNSFQNPDSEFLTKIKRLQVCDNVFQYLSSIIIGKAPELAVKLGLVGTRKELSDYFFQLVEKTLVYRKKNDVYRPDLLQLLNELMETTANTDDPFTWKELVAQCFMFFFAGFDTSATTMAFALYELSRNPEIQAKVRQEIEDLTKGELTYECLGELKYLQQCIDETLRLYPPVLNLDRVCAKEYQLNNTKSTIGRGVTVLIPIVSLHRDPVYYPDPEKFDPERFGPEQKKLRHPYLHLPFGQGPKNCIGSRFGLMQVKIGLVETLRRFKLRLSPKTKPVEMFKYTFGFKPTSPIYLEVEQI
ncbi:unnamed protein product [Phyllotreta striolata]|uniref:Cytochrome P450 n=1 Tax=Phyllotreta striolata TaxID=444603 RepID=A0A9N9TVG3_PHYSR|nr:unnamed protein product [Phyllotreta striolata]